MARGRRPKEMIADAGPRERLPVAPDHFGPDARDEWDRVVPLLVERQVLTDADLGLLERYCWQISVAIEAERLVSRDGVLMPNRFGELRRHPATMLAKEASLLARQIGAELGLTPVSRSRPAIRDDSADDDLLALV